ncbi:hypothetical protein SSS_06768 [Sarcoptes scabiei]|uniref:Proton-coupled folate transporter-like protein n=1 Tax=Sarcoptes scabiei TaxID=52283 RepID=A0A834R8Q3_SARSC|nr:hypothetical protein SSS_06768 [Sarcoptes scabiei]
MFQTFRRNNYYLFDLNIFLLVIAYSVENLTNTVLIQDKICLESFNQSEKFCIELNQLNPIDSDEVSIKNEILQQSATFKNYYNLMQAIPMIVWSFFLGSFIDQHPKTIRYIVAWINLIGFVTVLLILLEAYFINLNPYFLLLNGLLFGLTGSISTVLTVINQYIILNTEEEFRSIRFIILQISLVIGLATGSLIGGFLINLSSTQIRNYNLNCFISLLIYSINFVTIFLIKIGRHSTNEIVEPKSKTKNSQRSVLKIMLRFFSLDHVRQTLFCLIRPRPNRSRSHIFILISILFLLYVLYLGYDDLLFQFTQRVYDFDSGQYSRLAALTNLIPILPLLIACYLLINVFKLHDGTILMVAMFCGVLQQIMIGSLPTSQFYLIAITIGSMFGLASIIVKTKLSKIVPSNEIGKIFSLTSILEALSPSIGTLIFTLVFNANVDRYPTLPFHVGASITILTTIIIIFEELYFR